jgi:hypothetical protein
MEDDPIAKIAEEKIREAIEKGEFDNLPGKGKPVPVEDWTFIPEDLRVAYKVLKNSGFVPEQVSLQKEIEELRERLEVCIRSEEKERLKRLLSEKSLKYNILMENNYKR